MEALSSATTRMTEGELLQLNKTGDPDISEEDYREIISAKTGALISAACRIGAILGELPGELENALAAYGMKTGLVFQMADDILDYMADENELGKRLCKDLEEGKITLPLLHVLSTAGAQEVAEIKELFRKGLTDDCMPRIKELLKKYNSIEASFSKAQSLIDEAKAELSVFDDSQPKEALLAIADYSLRREK